MLHTGTMAVIGLLLLLLGVGEAAARMAGVGQPSANDCRTVLLSEPVYAVPEAFVQASADAASTRIAEAEALSAQATATTEAAATATFESAASATALAASELSATPTPTPTPEGGSSEGAAGATGTAVAASTATAASQQSPRTPTRDPRAASTATAAAALAKTRTAVVALTATAATKPQQVPTSVASATRSGGNDAGAALTATAAAARFTALATQPQPSATPSPINPPATSTPTPTASPLASVTSTSTPTLTATITPTQTPQPSSTPTTIPTNPPAEPTLEPEPTAPRDTPTPKPRPTTAPPSSPTRPAPPTPIATRGAPVGGGARGSVGLYSVAAPQQAQGKRPSARVRVKVEAPTSMDTGVSLPITVSVQPSDAEASTIRDAMKEYGATALVATVDGPGFELTPGGEQESPWIDEPELDWTWVGAAKSTGLQTLKVSLRMRGKPSWSDAPVEGEVWAGLMQVQVAESGGFNLGRFDIFSSINTLAGAGLTVPWLFEQVRKRMRRRRGMPASEAAGGEATA